MKLIIYFFFLLPTFLIAQNNLFFNRVLTFKMNSGLELSVPANKAWHIKSSNQPAVNFKTLSPEYGQIVNTTQSLSMLEGGVWLGEGDILVSTSGNSTFSILEYDVIPVSTNTGTSESTGFSSSGLEFNQVINISGTAFANSGNVETTDAVGIVDTFTVPDNKVWKVESAYGVLWGGPQNNFFLAQAQTSVQISGSLFKVNNLSTSGETQYQDDIYKQITLWVSGNINGGEATGQNTPIWLPSGTYKYQVHSDINSQSVTAYLSAVEFNVIQ